VVGRICIDMLRARQTRREEYAGIWLPEPLAVERRRVRTAPEPDRDSVVQRRAVDAFMAADPAKLLHLASPVVARVQTGDGKHGYGVGGAVPNRCSSAFRPGTSTPSRIAAIALSSSASSQSNRDDHWT
jgi:hypothetical protein